MRRIVWLVMVAACGPSGGDELADGGGGGGTPDAGGTIDVITVSTDAAPVCNGDPGLPDPASCDAFGVVMDPFYADRYTCFDLGPVPGVPPQKYGGLTLLPGRCQTTLIIGGEANYPEGAL